MSAMSYREDNMVLWRGVRPAHNGTQVLKYIPASNAVVLLHTVTAGKKLYLCNVSMFFYADASGPGHIYSDNGAGGDVVYHLMGLHFATKSTVPYIRSYWPPAEFPAGYRFYVGSMAVGVNLYGSIFGWEE